MTPNRTLEMGLTQACGFRTMGFRVYGPRIVVWAGRGAGVTQW